MMLHTHSTHTLISRWRAAIALLSRGTIAETRPTEVVDEPTSVAEEVLRPVIEGDGRWRRLGSLALGGTLVALGLRRRSLLGAGSALAGGWLIARGVRGSGDSRGAANARPSTVPTARERQELERGELERRELERREATRPTDATTVERSITILRPADELTQILRDPQQLAQVVGSVAEIVPVGEGRLHWSVSAPLGRRVTWETQVVEERPGELLRWTTTDGGLVSIAGSLRFQPAPADRGTEVTLRMRVDPPGGAVGARAWRYLDRAGLADYLGVVPGVLANAALRRLKSLAETGEVPTLAGNPSARGRGDWV